MKAKDIKEILVPTPGQLIVSVGLSIFLYWIAFRDTITAILFGGNQNIQPYFNQSYQIHLSRFSSLPIVDFLVKAVFWAGVGLIAYLIFLTISNFIIEAHNEAVVETEYVNKGRLEDRLSKPMQQLGLAIGLVIAILFSIIFLLPYWLSIFGSGLFGTIGLHSVAPLLLAIVGASINIYALWALCQLVFAVD